MPRTPRPTEEQLAAWRRLLTTYRALHATLERELQQERHLSMTSYEVLLRLWEAPGQRLECSHFRSCIRPRHERCGRFGLQTQGLHVFGDVEGVHGRHFPMGSEIGLPDAEDAKVTQRSQK